MTIEQIESECKSLNETKKEIDIKVEEKSNSIYMIYMNGIIDTYNSNEVSKVINLFLQLSEIKNIIIDLSGISYISSTGIGLFTNLLNNCNKNKISLYLMSIPPKIKEVIDLLGFTTFFNIINDISEINNVKKIFPLLINCPNCSVSLKMPRSGRFQCKSCKSILEIDEEGNLK